MAVYFRKTKPLFSSVPVHLGSLVSRRQKRWKEISIPCPSPGHHALPPRNGGRGKAAGPAALPPAGLPLSPAWWAPWPQPHFPHHGLTSAWARPHTLEGASPRFGNNANLQRFFLNLSSLAFFFFFALEKGAGLLQEVAVWQRVCCFLLRPEIPPALLLWDFSSFTSSSA